MQHGDWQDVGVTAYLNVGNRSERGNVLVNQAPLF
jgi:hypothetical protein